MFQTKGWITIVTTVILIIVGVNSCRIGKQFYAVNSNLEKAEWLLVEQKERIKTIDTARLKFDGGIGKHIAETAKSFTGQLGGFLSWIADANTQTPQQQAMSEKLADLQKAVSALVAAKDSKVEAEVQMKELDAEIDRAILEVRHLRDGTPSSFWQWALLVLTAIATVLVWRDWCCFHSAPAPATRARGRRSTP